MASTDPILDALLTKLNATQLQIKDQKLWDFLHDLIRVDRKQASAIAAIASSSGDGGSGSTVINQTIQQILFGDSSGDSDGLVIPGTPGPAGAAGADGITTILSIPIQGNDGADPDEPMMIPGSQGPQGNPGITQIFSIPLQGSDGDQGDDGFPIPGPSGIQGPGGGLVLLETQTASASSSLDFTSSISATYDDYLIEIISLVLSTNTAQLNLLVSTDGGSTYAITNYLSELLAERLSDATAVKVLATNGVMIINSYGTGVTRGCLSGRVRMFNPGDATNNKLFDIDVIGPVSDGTWYNFKGGSLYDSASAITDFQIKPTSGTITSGIVRCYGISKT